tara:strand:- start:455 stop:691 length:237 start_codon:yes stop_codon:yes gene_type:complete
MTDLSSSPPEQLAFFEPAKQEALKPDYENSVQRSHFSKAKSAAKVLGSRAALRNSEFTREQLKKMVLSHLKEGLREAG